MQRRKNLVWIMLPAVMLGFVMMFSLFPGLVYAEEGVIPPDIPEQTYERFSGSESTAIPAAEEAIGAGNEDIIDEVGVGDLSEDLGESPASSLPNNLTENSPEAVSLGENEKTISDTVKDEEAEELSEDKDVIEGDFFDGDISPLAFSSVSGVPGKTSTAIEGFAAFNSAVKMKNNVSPSFMSVKEETGLFGVTKRLRGTSTDLTELLKEVICNAPTDENGDYVIDLNQSFELTLIFKEKENLQFDDEAEMFYDLPSGLQVPDLNATSFDIDILGGSGPVTISGNTFKIDNGKLLVSFNQNDPNFDRLKSVANAEFRVDFSVQFDGSEEVLVFNSEIKKKFVYESNSDLEIEKKVTYNEARDTADYILQVKSVGLNENVTIQDHLTGTALIFNQDVTVESSLSGNVAVTPDYSTIANGFVIDIPRMENGEILTIRYSAEVDNSKITQNGTVGQTNNTAKVVSEQVPDGKEVSVDFSGKVNFHKISKIKQGEPVPLDDNLYETEWLIQVNSNHKLVVGGQKIMDWIDSGSQSYMWFAGDGITMEVTLENGVQETRVIPWSELNLNENNNRIYRWDYVAPETDGKASYLISCKTIIDASNAYGELTAVNRAQFLENSGSASVKIPGTGIDTIDPEKKALSNTAEETEWEITVRVPGSGLPDFTIVDDMPRLNYEGQTFIDYLVDGSMTVDGLINNESYSFYLSTTLRSFSVTFYRDQGKTQQGLSPTADGEPRNIVLRFKTTVNQDWLELAESSGYTKYAQHTNSMTARAGNSRIPANATVIPIRPYIEKELSESTSIEIDGVTYPVFRYELTLLGPTEDGAVITDIFDTNFLKLYDPDTVTILGGMSLNPTDSNGTVLAVDTENGIQITVSNFPKNKDGSFYAVYKIKYALIVKDKDALDALNQSAALNGGHTLANVASWNQLVSNKVYVTHFYYPYVDKELVVQASEENDYIAEFKLIVNQYADDLDPSSDTLNIMDELSGNLRFIQGSLEISPENNSIKVQFDRDSNALIFTDVPDNERFEITYRAKVLGTGNVSYSNTVKFGKYEKTIEESVQIDSSGSGSGSNPSITLIKQDADDINTTLAGAWFRLFYMDGNERIPVLDKNDNDVLFVTGSDGTVLISGDQALYGWTLWEDRTYLLIEIESPFGYEVNEDPVFFILTQMPSSQMEYSLVGDQLSVVNTVIKINIPVQKQWIGPAAGEVTIRLTADGQEIRQLTLNASNEWKGSFDGLAKYDSADGHEIVYGVSEDPVTGYESEPSGSIETGITFTNRNTDTINIPVQKQWIGPAVGEVTIRLTADGNEIRQLTLNASNDWKGSFDGLVKYDSADGHEIVYGVSEDPVSGYESEPSGDVQTGITFTNRNTDTINIPVQKQWIGPAAGDVTIRLTADGNEIRQLTLNASNEWKGSFDGLAKYDSADGHEIVYGVSEDPVSGYESEPSGDVQTGITFTNRNTDTINIPVQKQWIGPAAGDVTIRLTADGNEIRQLTLNASNEWKGSFDGLAKYDSADGHEIVYGVSEDPVSGYESEPSGDVQTGITFMNRNTDTINIPVQKQWIGPAAGEVTIRLTADGNEIRQLTLNASNEWKGSFDGLAKYDSADGHEIVYGVSEDPVSGYESEPSGSIETGITFTNRNTETISVTGNKTWEDNNDQDGVRPDSITIHLLADGKEVASRTVTAAEEWKWSFDNLPKYENGTEIKYTVTEDAVANYETTYDGFSVTNTHVPGTISVTGSKTWEDSNDQDGVRPDSITIRLLADGKEVANKIVTAAEEWKWSFDNLPKYENGTEIKYTVTEDAVANYETTYDGFNVMNTHAPGTVSVTVSKSWDDGENQDGIRPDTVTIQLFADGKDTGKTLELTVANNWTGSFTDLDMYIDGKEVSYTVAEIVIDGYTAVISRDAKTGFSVTNTHAPGTISVTGGKTWEDNNDQDGVRPDSITIRLLADGKEVASRTVTAAEEWKWSFDNLPKYENGTEIKYTVTEDAVSNYETTYDGFNVTNTHVPGTISVTGGKTWEDSNDQDGVRPDSITIRLLADGKEVASRTVTAAEEWKWSFDNLPKYENGAEIKYTITEDAVEGYEAAYDGFSVTNTHAPEKISIKVSKTWKDQDDKDGLRPKNVTIRLTADGVDTGKVLVLDENNRWAGEFANLDRCKDGKEIVYTVTEDKVTGYTTEITGNAKEGFSVVNFHTPETPVQKTDKPKGTTPVKTSVSGNPQTGDEANLILYFILMAAAFVGIVSLLLFRRKRINK
ncbi:MAG: Cna B-type domain-containing protein [Bacillota bacterium]|jgi:hypothetical protein